MNRVEIETHLIQNLRVILY